MPPHDPPVQTPLSDRTISTPTTARLPCPRPVVRLPVRSGRRGGIELDVPFLVDTGSDVSMVPAGWAWDCRVAGYDPAVVVSDTDTTFHGRMRGRWGTMGTRIGARQLTLPCFYFIDLLPASGWFSGWLTRFRRRQPHAGFGPFVLGRAGLFPFISLLVESGRVCLSDQPFR